MTLETSKFIVLVVEDDRFLHALLREKLEHEGWHVVSAENGQEALTKLKEEQRPHIVLLDLLLPVVDGFEVLKQMRDDPSLKRIPVVVLSNLGQEEDVRRAKSLGARDYMVKAYFTPGEIIDKLKTTIRQEYL